jgi:hypothetical protein
MDCLMRLDSKSARRIATGILEMRCDDFTAAAKALLTPPPHTLSPRASSLRKRVESNIRAVQGDSFINGGWDGRTYNFIAFEVQHSNEGMPLQLAIILQSFNTRSNAQRVSTVALVTMHAMERLMERRHDADLMRLAHAEFDTQFLAEIGLNTEASKLPIKEEFRIRTTHGLACGIVSETGLPIVRTWISRPEG